MKDSYEEWLEKVQAEKDGVQIYYGYSSEPYIIKITRELL